MDAAVKIALGMVAFFTKFVFVDRMCFIYYADECPAMIDLSVPNGIVAFSLLCIFGSCRFVRLLFSKPVQLPWVLEFLIDGMITTYLTDLSLRQLWVPMLNFAHRLCTKSSAFLMDLGRGNLVSSVKPIAIWMQSDAIEVFRFTFALLFVYTMLHVTGVTAAFAGKYFEWFGRAPGDNMNWQEDPRLLLEDDDVASSMADSKSGLELKVNRKRRPNDSPVATRRSTRSVSFQN